MEELQDAIEDAQYMNAMHDSIPRPTQDWRWPSTEEFKDYLEKVRITAPKSFEAEGLCRGSLGFYTFMRFCKGRDPVTKVMAEFMEEVAAFRAKVSSGSLLAVAVQITDRFLEKDSTGECPDPLKPRPSNLVRHIPSKSDVEKHVPTRSPRGSQPTAPYAPRAPLGHWSKYIQLENEGIDNALKITGWPLEEMLNSLAENTVRSEKEAASRREEERVAHEKKILAEKPESDKLKPLRPDKKVLSVGNNEIRREKKWRERHIDSEGGNLELDAEVFFRVRMDLFDELEGLIFKHVVDTHFSEFNVSPAWTKLFQYLFMTERTVVEDDFALFRVLGRGGFGLVNACKRCTTGKLYAMKMLSKKRVKMKRAEALCINERSILANIQSPYVVCLKYAFTTDTDVFLILDLMTGGDLGYHLSQKGRFTMRETKYYAARTLLGIAAMHDKSIAYRDLKPENILMDDQGYTKISDLGLACKVGKSGLSGACGTRGYWAPEMLKRDADGKRERYTMTVDWFSFGCCVYEFMYGTSPFRIEKARKWGDFPIVDKADRDRATDLATLQMEPDFESRVFNSVSKDFIGKLLMKDAKLRLGANGYEEIIAHPFFKDMDWDNLSRMKPPMKPARDLNMPTQNEIGTFTDDKITRKLQLTCEDHSMYSNWEFISKRSFQEEVVEYLVMEEKLGSIVIYYPNHGCCAIS